MFGLTGDPFYNHWVFANLAGAKLSVSALVPNIDPNHMLLPSQPLIDLQGKIFAYLLGPAGAYNLIIILGFVLTFVASYLLAGKIFQTMSARIFSALIITFLPFRLAHSQVHINMVSTQWLIFSIYFLIGLKEKKTLLGSLLLGLFLTLTFLDNYQYGLFAVFAVLVFAICELGIAISRKKYKDYFAFVFKLFISAVLLLVLMAIFDSKLIGAILGGNSISSLGAVRNFGELKVYSSHLPYYVLPSPMLKFLSGSFMEIFATKARELGTNTIEQTLFLGWIPLTLAGISLFFRSKTQNYKIYFLIIAIVAFIFSIAPTISILGFAFNSPAYYLFNELPVIRVYARFGLLAGIAVAILAGYTIERIGNKKISTVIILALTFLSLLEFYPKNIFPTQNTTNPPQVYVELAKLEPGIVAEYPLLPAEEPKSYDYLLWQTYHHFPLIYGSSANSTGESLRRDLVNPSEVQTIKKLKAFNVKYLIIHKDKYLAGDSWKYPAEYNSGKVPDLNGSAHLLVSTNESSIYLLK